MRLMRIYIDNIDISEVGIWQLPSCRGATPVPRARLTCKLEAHIARVFSLVRGLEPSKACKLFYQFFN